MAVLKRVLVGLLVLIVALVAIAFLLPRKVHVERSLVIGAPPATVFTLTNGFRGFNRWSPWFERDPNAAYVYEGPDQGVGARMTWKSDKKDVGSGSQEIVASTPWESVAVHLEFAGEGGADTRFAFAPQENGTKVTWSFDTDLGSNPVARYFGLMFDRFVGPDYEKGLAKLKALAEGLPRTDFSDLAVEAVRVSPATLAFVSARTSKDPKEIGAAIGAAYAEVQQFIAKNGLDPAGAPLCVTTKWETDAYEFDAGFPVNRAPDGSPPATGRVKVRQTYGGKALKVDYYGPYENMEPTYEKLFAYAAASAMERAGDPWEEYLSDPASTPPEKLLTRIYLPVK